MTARATSPVRTRVFATIAAFALGLAGVVLIAAPAHAATITVMNENDAGPGSLRQAVSDANTGDTINFDSTVVHTINLVSNIAIFKTLTIIGPGEASLTIGRIAGTFDQFTFAPLAVGQDLTISDLTIAGIDGAGEGVGIHVVTGTQAPQNLTLTRVTVRNEASSSGAAAVRSDSTMTGTVTMTDATFTDNNDIGGAGSYGGAIWLLAVAGNILIDGSTFDGNSAGTRPGGGLAIQSSSTGSTTITGSTFTNNSGESGGAIYLESGGVVIITASTFGQNTSSNGGGAIYVQPTSLTVTGSTFTDNKSAGNSGGALVVSGGNTLDVASSTFTGNTAGINGGAVYVSGDTPDDTTFSNSTFTGNGADGEGGAISLGTLVGGTAQITDSTFTNSTAGDRGGAIFATSVIGAGTLTIASSTFAGNSSGTFGTSIFVDTLSGLFTMAQSTVDDVDTNGGLFGLAFGTVDKGSTDLVLGIGLSTIVAPGVLHIAQGNTGLTLLLDSILSSSSTTNALVLEDAQLTYRVTMKYDIDSDVGTYPWIDDQGGNQFSVADPMLATLADNGGPTFTRLPLAGSPAINLGDPAIVGAPSTDQRGTGFARISGGRVDIGAVEVQAALAATGSELPWIPAGVALLLLLAGASAVGIRRISATR